MLFDDTYDDSKLRERRLTHIKVSGSDELNKYYRLKEVLGQGSFGKVIHAVQCENNAHWAIKIISKDQAAWRVKMVEREIRILKLVQHPNVIHLQRVMETPKTLYLVFELCHGVLSKLFREKTHFSDQETRVVIGRLASAVSYLHQNDIVHRDLKLDNILITVNPLDPSDRLFIKVTDFGLSVVKGGSGMESLMQETCGTPAYMAPELINDKMYSNQCDIWSIGVIMYAMLSGVFPFETPNEGHLRDLILHSEPNFDMFPWAGKISGSALLIRKMLNKNPAFRITAAEIEKSSWIKNSEEDSESNVMELMHLWKDDLTDPAVIPGTERESLSLVTETMLRTPTEYRYSDRTLRQQANMEQDRRTSIVIRHTFGQVVSSETLPSDRRRSSLAQMGGSDTDYDVVVRVGYKKVKEVPESPNILMTANNTNITIKTTEIANISKKPSRLNHLHQQNKTSPLENPTTSFGVVVQNEDCVSPLSTTCDPPIICTKKTSKTNMDRKTPTASHQGRKGDAGRAKKGKFKQQ